MGKVERHSAACEKVAASLKTHRGTLWVTLGSMTEKQRQVTLACLHPAHSAAKFVWGSGR